MKERVYELGFSPCFMTRWMYVVIEKRMMNV